MLVPSSGESHLFAANVYPQDELGGVNKVQRERGALYALRMVRRRTSLSICLL
jgi:hypothetical protein